MGLDGGDIGELPSEVTVAPMVGFKECVRLFGSERCSGGREDNWEHPFATVPLFGNEF